MLVCFFAWLIQLNVHTSASVDTFQGRIPEFASLGQASFNRLPCLEKSWPLQRLATKSRLNLAVLFQPHNNDEELPTKFTVFQVVWTESAGLEVLEFWMWLLFNQIVSHTLWCCSEWLQGPDSSGVRLLWGSDELHVGHAQETRHLIGGCDIHLILYQVHHFLDEGRTCGVKVQTNFLETCILGPRSTLEVQTQVFNTCVLSYSHWKESQDIQFKHFIAWRIHVTFFDHFLIEFAQDSISNLHSKANISFRQWTVTPLIFRELESWPKSIVLLLLLISDDDELVWKFLTKFMKELGTTWQAQGGQKLEWSVLEGIFPQLKTNPQQKW